MRRPDAARRPILSDHARSPDRGRRPWPIAAAVIALVAICGRVGLVLALRLLVN